MPRGGKRPGAGRKKGTKGLDKEAARARLRELVMASLDPMVEAQVAHAKGIKYLMTREGGTGKWIKVTEAMAGNLGPDVLVEVWEKDPSIQAFTDLLNRTIDKPIEQVQQEVSGGLTVKWES
jgi:hypothetical protein